VGSIVAGSCIFGALWLVFTSARIPYRGLLAAPESEVVEVELSETHCRVLGVTAATDAARRRTFNEAGRRVCRADTEFEAFEAHGGRGLPSFLRVVKRRRVRHEHEPGQLAPAA
jgi:hypothetical protein